MRYSEELIEGVRGGNDIVDIISGYVQLKRKGNSYFGLCPFHNEKSPSFSVSREKQMYYCFGCGAGGNVYTFLMQYENLTFQEAVAALAERAGIALPEGDYSEDEKKQQDRRTALLSIQKEAAKYYYAKLHGSFGKTGMRYLQDRGLTPETILRFGLGFSDQNSKALYHYLKGKYPEEILQASGLFAFHEKYGVRDKFWNRVMFPIMDINHRVIGFGGRVTGDAKPKYLNSPETEIFEKSRNLYGLNFARRGKTKEILLCEGYMDVISMHQAGFTNAVASLGTSLTSGHCSLLKRYAERVYLLYDSDEAGIRAALRAIPMLRDAGLAAKVVSLKPYKDPDEFVKAEGSDAFSERLSKAEDGFLFEISMLERDFDLKDPRGRSDFLHEAGRYLLMIEDEIEREMYIRAIASRYMLEKETLLRLIGKLSLQNLGKKEIVLPKKLQSPKKEAYHADDSQRQLLSIMANSPELIKGIMSYLKIEDFTDETLKTVLKMLIRQTESGSCNLAEILNCFEDSEKQSYVASLFHMPPQFENAAARQMAVKDMIGNLWYDGVQRRISACQDPEEINELIQELTKVNQFRASGSLEFQVN